MEDQDNVWGLMAFAFFMWLFDVPLLVAIAIGGIYLVVKTIEKEGEKKRQLMIRLRGGDY